MKVSSCLPQEELYQVDTWRVTSFSLCWKHVSFPQNKLQVGVFVDSESKHEHEKKKKCEKERISSDNISKASSTLDSRQ